MGASRKRRRLVGFRTRIDRDEELGRFGKLAAVVLVIEVVLFLWITGVVRPL